MEVFGGRTETEKLGAHFARAIQSVRSAISGSTFAARRARLSSAPGL
jgi:hypothetical protein